MLRLLNRRSLSGIALAASLCVSSHVFAAAGEAITFSIDIPKSIGDLKFVEARKATEQSRSTQFLYKAPGKTLTVYIFGSTPEPPDGIDSDELRKEFEQAKAAIRDPRSWNEARQVREGATELGTGPQSFVAREAVFKIKSEDGSATSFLYLTAARGVFFKTRYTVWRQHRKTGEAQIPRIREALGEIIQKVIEKKEDAT